MALIWEMTYATLLFSPGVPGRRPAYASEESSRIWRRRLPGVSVAAAVRNSGSVAVCAAAKAPRTKIIHAARFLNEFFPRSAFQCKAFGTSRRGAGQAQGYTGIVMSNAVCLLSGGLDSATCLALARREGYACYALSFDYGQRHKIELTAAARVAETLGAARHLVVKIDLRVFGGSALTSDIAVPKGREPGHMADIP